VDVVLAVRVAVSAVEPLIATDVGERLHVTGLVAPDGDVVTAQVSATVPENELDGVTVIVEVLPEVAPGLLTLMVPLLERLKSEEPTGFQKPLQPARSRGIHSASVPHFFDPIATPPQRAQLYRKERTGRAFRIISWGQVQNRGFALHLLTRQFSIPLTRQMV
jgi:hypothetical protein